MLCCETGPGVGWLGTIETTAVLGVSAVSGRFCASGAGCCLHASVRLCRVQVSQGNFRLHLSLCWRHGRQLSCRRLRNFFRKAYSCGGILSSLFQWYNEHNEQSSQGGTGVS